MSGFCDHLRPKIIPCQPTEAQVNEKIMNWRKKYKKVTSFVTRGENAEDESVYRQDFQLWNEFGEMMVFLHTRGEARKA